MKKNTWLHRKRGGVWGKWLTLLLGMCIAAISPGMAVNKCGVGPTITQSNTLVSQLGATFTDGSISSSTTNLSAITSGTSGCTNDGFVLKGQQQLYVAHNYAQLEESLATGKGPHVDALLFLMQCSPEVKSTFVQQAQKHYTLLFPDDIAEEARTDEFLDAFQQLVQTHPNLVSQCVSVI